MYKLVVFVAMMAVCAAAPAAKPSLVYSSPYVASAVVPAVTSYSAYSSNVVHGSPVYSVPLVHTQVVQPLVHSSPLVHSVPLTYAAGVAYV